MIKFLLKGILRDKRRSILPIIIVSVGVFLTVFLSGYIRGAMGDVVDQTARFQSGHIKVMTRAYSELASQMPNDLALLEVDKLIRELREDLPDFEFVERVRFGGLLDVPAEDGGSKGQGPVAGMAFRLFDESSGESERLNIEKSLVEGKLPQKYGEAIIGYDFANKLKVNLGDEVTYFGTTMNGSMTFYNFIISGLIRFGTPVLDKGALIVDISDAQKILDMENGASEILGFQKSNVFEEARTSEVSEAFNSKYANSSDEFAPTMQTLREQNGLGELLDYANSMSGIFVFVFVGAMSVVLWNTGLIGGLRRYQEFGIRMALGESKGRIFWSLVMEAFLIGIIGSIVGTILGVAGAWYLQVVGIDISGLNQNSTMLMPSVIRAKVTPELFFIGFIPGVLAMVLGNMLSGRGIYKRETASLFKELEI